MNQREKILRRYLRALDRLEKTKEDDVIAEFRNASSLKELATLANTVIAQSDLGFEGEHLVIVEPLSRYKQRQFVFSGWARKAGLVRVPLLER